MKPYLDISWRARLIAAGLHLLLTIVVTALGIWLTVSARGLV